MTSVEQSPNLKEPLEAAVTAWRMVGYYQAQVLERLAEYARATEDDEFAYLEVSTLLHISDRAAQQRLMFARELTDRLPRTLEALRDGKIEEFRARLITEAVATLSDDTPPKSKTESWPKPPSRPPANSAPPSPKP